MVKKEFLRSILAGVYISLAGVVFLKVGGILGAIFFGFGLLGVIQTGSLLYTGRIFWEDNLKTLGMVLGGNVLGCFLIGSIFSSELKETAEVIINSRINDSLPAVFMKGSFCGLIMTTAVKRKIGILYFLEFLFLYYRGSIILWQMLFISCYPQNLITLCHGYL